MIGRLLLCVVLGVLSGACRDEQAGPKHRASRATALKGADIRTLNEPPSDLTFRSGATWAQGTIQYLGSKVEPAQAQPGQPVTLRHYFRALRPPPSGFGFFVHVLDATSGGLAFNADHELQDGAAPLERWPVGPIIEDRHQIPAPASPGHFRVVLGFWQGDARLPVDDPAAHDGLQRMLGPTLGAPQALPEYRIGKTRAPPRIDGVLDDDSWQNARAVELVGSFDGRKPLLRTTARMTYDDEHLYVAFDIEDPDVWGTLKNSDDPIYNEEVVEVFIDANGDGRTYNELQVSPHNVTFDAYFVARRSDLEAAKAWKSQMRTMVKVRGTVDNPADQDQGWSAEMAIPISKLAEVPNVPPKAGDRWRFNLYRLEHHQRRQVEGQAFAPLFVGDFHHLPKFGWLIFE